MSTTYGPSESARQLLVAALPIAADTEGAGPGEAAQTLRALAADAGPDTVEALAVAAAVLSEVAVRAGRGSVNMDTVIRQLGAALQLWQQNRRDAP